MSHTFKLARRMARWRRESRAFPLTDVRPGSQGSRQAPTGRRILTPVRKVNSKLLQSVGGDNVNRHIYMELPSKLESSYRHGVNLLEVARTKPGSQDVSRGARVGYGMASVAPEHLSQDGTHANV
jgi:hypothetical protein